MTSQSDEDEDFVVNTRDLNFTQDRARLEFLKAIERTAPEVIATLKENVLPHYEAILDMGYESEPVRWSWLIRRASYKHHAEEKATLVKLLREFKQAIEHWAEKWRLADGGDWFYDCALSTLNHWSSVGTADGWDPEYKPGTFLLLLGKHFKFEFLEWDPKTTTWPDYKKSMDEAYEKARGDYRTRIRPNKRNVRARKTHELKHYKWLVEYQVRGKGYAEIAQVYQDESGLDSSSVGEAVRQLASLIGIRLRPARRPSQGYLQ